MLSLAAVVLIAPVKFELSIPSIMRAPMMIGSAPRSLRWNADGSQLYFTWAKATGTEGVNAGLNVVSRDGTGLAPASGFPATPTNPWDRGTKVGDRVAYSDKGDIFLYDTLAKTSSQVTETPEREDNPRLTSDGLAVIYNRDGDIWRLTLADKKLDQLTTMKVDPARTATSLPTTIKTPEGMMSGSVVASATGTHASIDFTTPATGGRIAEVPSYITSSGYAQMLRTYERAGAPQSTSKVVIYDLRTGAMTEIVTPRAGRVSPIRWSPNGKNGVAWAFSNDYKDAWLMGFDTATNKASVLFTDHDDAWLGGPGRGLLAWLPDSSRFYFQSEQNGFANLYTMAPTDVTPKNITEGQFEVSDVRLDMPRNRFVFVSSEGSPYLRHIDEVSIDGGPRNKLADFSADEDAVFAMSPDGKDFAVVKSTSSKPPELFLNGKQITTTPTEEWLSGPWIDPPIVDVPARDGTKVPAKLFKPKKWRKGGPAVIFIHGAGYLQNVYEGWSHYFREYMFHHVLMDKGYAVLDIDYRASAGYGKAWRTAIYRHMGGKDLDDVVDGAAYLVKEVGAAPDRLGVYGGSYGGFLTLMAMFNSPDTFKAGAALRPVTDWASYHHGYTVPILNTPQDDPEAYKRSSPINFVEGLKNHLLICHGVVDVNVHFQDSIRVAQRLIELGKDNWEIAPYPVEDHAFRRPESWTDEYKRIFNLFERTIGNTRKR